MKNNHRLLPQRLLDQPVGVAVGMIKVVDGATVQLGTDIPVMVDGANVLMSSILHTVKHHLDIYSIMK